VKRGGGVKGKLKKAAVVGGAAYTGYKLGKLKSKFSKKKKGKKSKSRGYEFDDWNDWQEADGFLCRKTDDCTWLDDNLECQDFEVKITPVNKLWFGGDLVSIVGECACSDEWFWDGDDLECKRPAKVAGWLVGVIIMAVIAVIVAGIIVIYFCAYKK